MRRGQHADTHPADQVDTWQELRLVTVHGDEVVEQSLLWVGDWLSPNLLRKVAEGWSGVYGHAVPGLIKADQKESMLNEGRTPGR